MTYDFLEMPSEKELFEKLPNAYKKLREKQKRFKFYPNWDFWIFPSDPLHFSRIYTATLADPEHGSPETRGLIRYTLNTRLLWAILHQKMEWDEAQSYGQMEVKRAPDLIDTQIDILMCFFHL